MKRSLGGPPKEIAASALCRAFFPAALELEHDAPEPKAEAAEDREAEAVSAACEMGGQAPTLASLPPAGTAVEAAVAAR